MTKAELTELYKLMFPEYPDIVSVSHIQSMLSISRHAVYELISDGWIPVLKIGNAYRIPTHSIKLGIFLIGRIYLKYLHRESINGVIILLQKGLYRGIIQGINQR